MENADKIIEFLVEDFRDTSGHLKATDRKIEFTFQLFTGAFSLLTSLIISLLVFTFENSSFDQYRESILIVSLFILCLVFVFAWWAFFYTLKGTKIKTLYINRLNFLRKEIYTQLDKKLDQYPGFLYIDPLPAKESLRKVGMLSMFPLGLRYIIIFTPCPISILLFVLLGNSYPWLFVISTMIIMIVIFVYTLYSWKDIHKETQKLVEKSWGVFDQN